jgi:hypothetical protein
MKSFVQKGAIGLALVAAGVLAGEIMPSARVAHGEVRTAATPQGFQSGAQVSLPLLKEISATLQQIDARLARMETLAQKMQIARPTGPGSK